MTLTKDTIVNLLTEKMGYSLSESKQFLEILLEEIKSRLEEGQEVKISGFGKWSTHRKNPRPGRNPHTGDKIEISARRVVTFSPSDQLRNAVNTKPNTENPS